MAIYEPSRLSGNSPRGASEIDCAALMLLVASRIADIDSTAIAALESIARLESLFERAGVSVGDPRVKALAAAQSYVREVTAFRLDIPTLANELVELSG